MSEASALGRKTVVGPDWCCHTTRLKKVEFVDLCTCASYKYGKGCTYVSQSFPFFVTYWLNCVTIVQLYCSTCPFAWGWSAVDFRFFALNIVHRAVNSFLVNLTPSFIRSETDMPKRTTLEVKSAFATCDEDVLWVRIAPVSFEYLSVMTVTNWFSITIWSRDPRMPIATNSSGPLAGKTVVPV